MGLCALRNLFYRTVKSVPESDRFSTQRNRGGFC